MANCTINEGHVLGCPLDSMGGVKEVYIANWSAATDYSVDATDTITGITSGSTYYLFEQVKETSGVNETMVADILTGSLIFEQKLSLVFNKMTADLRQTLMLLVRAYTTVIVKDQNGLYWILGSENGLNLTEGTSGTGVAYSDRNGFAITLGAKERESIRPIAYSAFSSYIG